MRITGKLRHLAVFTSLLVCTAAACAVTLGRVRGAALIGRPLNLSIPVTLDAAESESCLQAEVLQGDSRMPGVALRVERAADGSQLLRLSSSAPVEEPVLTLFVRAGCGQQVTRRYVVLSEYPEEAATSFPGAVPARGAPAAPLQAPASAVRAERAPRRASVPQVQADAAPPKQAASKEAPAAAPRKSRAKKESADTAASKPRLKLEPLDLSIDTSPTLKVAPELHSPAGDPARRAEAAALWRALNTPPEELARQNRRIEAMEGEVKGLRSLVQQNTAALNQVGQQLEKARSERNSVSTALVALAVLLLASGAYWGWRRWQRPVEPGRRWWQRDGQGAPDTEFPDGPLTSGRATRPPAEAKPSTVDLDLSGYVYESEPPAAKVAPARKAAQRQGPISGPPSDFMHSQPAIMRMVKAEELIDIQQQAEFFFSIGDTEQALAVLESHVHDHVETSPVAWLDLLEAYHRLGRRDDYDRIRREFHALFNAQVPDFDDYRDASAGLEDYRRAMSRIVALWPSPRVLGVIEESIFRKPGTPGAEPFDLQAYRDLLMLYNLAKEIAREGAAPAADSGTEGDSLPGRTGFRSTNLQPLPASDSGLTEPAPLPSEPLLASQIPPASPNLGLDIDLGELEPMPPADLMPPPAAGESAPASDSGQLLSFDFELLPPGSPPSDTSRR